MTVLEFIFKNFWHWLGTFILIGAIGSIFHGMISKAPLFKIQIGKDIAEKIKEKE